MDKKNQYSKKPDKLLEETNVSSATIKILRGEIDELVDRLTIKIKTENEFLKEKVRILEQENIRLNEIVSGVKITSTIDYFMPPVKNFS